MRLHLSRVIAFTLPRTCRHTHDRHENEQQSGWMVLHHALCPLGYCAFQGADEVPQSSRCRAARFPSHASAAAVTQVGSTCTGLNGAPAAVEDVDSLLGLCVFYHNLPVAHLQQARMNQLNRLHGELFRLQMKGMDRQTSSHDAGL